MTVSTDSNDLRLPTAAPDIYESLVAELGLNPVADRPRVVEHPRRPATTAITVVENATAVSTAPVVENAGAAAPFPVDLDGGDSGQEVAAAAEVREDGETDDTDSADSAFGASETEIVDAAFDAEPSEHVGGFNEDTEATDVTEIQPPDDGSAQDVDVAPVTAPEPTMDGWLPPSLPVAAPAQVAAPAVEMDSYFVQAPMMPPREQASSREASDD